MSPPKLSDTDKQELVDLYRQTPATTTILAERFGVSISTVSRLLKTAIAATEYEDLVLEKRGSRFSKGNPQLVLPLTKEKKSGPVEQQQQEATPNNAVAIAKSSGDDQNQENNQGNPGGKRRRTRSRKTSDSALTNPEINEVEEVKKVVIAPPVTISESVELPDDLIEEMQGWKTEVEPLPAKNPRPQIVSIKSSALDEIVKDIDEDLDLLDDDEDLDDDLDDLDEDEEDDETDDNYPEEQATVTDKSFADDHISVLPFAGATMPKHCYLVVDNKSDLIVRPLNEFGLDGQLPPTELKEKTLPIFDNHRVARRFSLRTQKVIKMPNGEIVQKASQALKAKGITRVFINGKVYAL